MASASKKTSTDLIDVEELLDTYVAWLDRPPLADRSRDAYRAQVAGYAQWLASSEHGMEALSGSAVRDWAVRDYKRFVEAKKWKPSSVNQALAAIDNFYRSLGIARPDVAREELAQLAPRALDADEQRRFLRAVEQSPSARDRAIAVTFFYTGLRLSELADLTVDDVAVSARRGRVTVRSGKGDQYREIPLNSGCRAAMTEWSIERADQLDGDDSVESGWWLSRTGSKMTPRAIDLVVRKIAKTARLELSAHVLGGVGDCTMSGTIDNNPDMVIFDDHHKDCINGHC